MSFYKWLMIFQIKCVFFQFKWLLFTVDARIYAAIINHAIMPISLFISWSKCRLLLNFSYNLYSGRKILSAIQGQLPAFEWKLIPNKLIVLYRVKLKHTKLPSLIFFLRSTYIYQPYIYSEEFHRVKIMAEEILVQEPSGVLLYWGTENKKEQNLKQQKRFSFQEIPRNCYDPLLKSTSWTVENVQWITN